MYQDDLAKLSKEALIALVLAQAAQIEELTRRIAELEARLGGPPKTPDNSSIPPSQGRKPSRAARRAVKKRKGRPGVFRALAANPDRIIESVAERCPHCAHAPSDFAENHAGPQGTLAIRLSSSAWPIDHRIQFDRNFEQNCEVTIKEGILDETTLNW